MAQVAQLAVSHPLVRVQHIAIPQLHAEGVAEAHDLQLAVALWIEITAHVASTKGQSRNGTLDGL